eukprot:8340155-Karenia_brevis.AAC.1
MIFKNYIESRVSQWSAVPILDCATYLGFDVGPKAALTVWSKALEGWHKSAQLIGKAEMTAYMRAFAYNSRSISKLSYLIQ